MVAASLLDEDDVTRALARIAERFPGAMLAFDTYSRATFGPQHAQAARKGMSARWAWACDKAVALTLFRAQPAKT